ncbi:hypothetical protein M758_4G197500 [Ceratodon purpureus]|nr:hypothetical protein M758_4G197500 [Ceratodon purpureus]
MGEFLDAEAVNGIRMAWNVWPSTKLDASKCHIPLAALYTPLHGGGPYNPVTVLNYPPLRCRTCRGVLNPYCQVDYNAKLWICPFCHQRNPFPAHYASISEQNVPGELWPQCSTVEYAPPPVPGSERTSPPVFLFVVDTCIIEEELGYLKASLTQAIALVPENALVGLITFGGHVQVHELGFSDFGCPKAYVFRGSKELTKEQVLDQLGLPSGPGGGFQRGGLGLQGAGGPGAVNGTYSSGVDRFLRSVSDCEFVIHSLLDELQRDSFPVSSDQRPARCTGAALKVAAGMLAACSPDTGARIIGFVGGPCTDGPGVIVSKELTDPIRSHKDLAKDTAAHYTKAVKFYEGLATQLVTQGHVLDIFACAVDQIGVMEMKCAIERTGGLVVLAESFGHSVFKDSFKRIFETGDHSLNLSFNGEIELNCSKDIKVQGAIGPCASMAKKGISTSDTVVGQGGTTVWKMCGLDRSTTLAFFFEVSPTTQGSGVQLGGKPFSLQFVTQYQHSDGQTRLRVVTVTRRFGESSANSSTEEMVSGFDQEAATVILARWASFKMETEDEFDATRFLDRLLIRVSQRFGDYRKEDPTSFRFASTFGLLPQFMFNLRRSQFVQVFNNSPDETAYFRMVLNRENVTNSLVMIQPSLIAYSLNGPPEPVLLDVASIAPDRILLLDAYFSVVVFHGMTVAQWRNAGYHLQPDQVAFAQLLQAPQDDAQTIITERFPVPRLVVCDQHKSQARFLLARLNPSATYNSANVPAPGGDIIFTDDVSLQVFVEHLQRLAVAQS